jgi:hypothetical protein
MPIVLYVHVEKHQARLTCRDPDVCNRVLPRPFVHPARVLARVVNRQARLGVFAGALAFALAARAPPTDRPMQWQHRPAAI